MTDSLESIALAKRAVRHLEAASDILKRLNRPFDPTPSAAVGAHSLQTAANEALAPSEADGTEENPSLESLRSLWQLQRSEDIRSGEFYTNDRVEVRGRLGKEDNRQMLINGRPAIKLDRREHAIMLILASFARFASGSARMGKQHLPAFMPVGLNVATLDQLTANGGALSGLWRTPADYDVHRCIGSLREVLRQAGLNRNLIESGQRGAGYRISTLTSNLLLEEDKKSWNAFWPPLFEAALRESEVQGRRSIRDSQTTRLFKPNSTATRLRDKRGSDNSLAHQDQVQ